MNEIASTNEAEWAPKESQATCDQEEWVKGRLATTIRMALKMKEGRRIQADEAIYQHALRGLIEGAAEEIIKTLGMVPVYENIRRHDAESWLY